MRPDLRQHPFLCVLRNFSTAPQPQTPADVRSQPDVTGPAGTSERAAASGGSDPTVIEPSRRSRPLSRVLERYSHGFAGFEAPACLRLAEAGRVADPGGHARVERALERALAAAHCVQDSPFCAQTTSRCNALARRWWGSFLAVPRPPLNVEAVVARFRRDPSAAEFAAVHVVGEQYPPPAASPLHLAFRHWAAEARTLLALARLYERPVGDLLRLNPDLDADTALGETAGPTSAGHQDGGRANPVTWRVSSPTSLRVDFVVHRSGGTESPRSSASTRARPACQSRRKTRLIPAITAVARIQPAIISVYASHCPRPGGLYVLRSPNGPMGTRRSRV